MLFFTVSVVVVVVVVVVVGGGQPMDANICTIFYIFSVGDLLDKNKKM
jgi:hypothetical protein